MPSSVTLNVFFLAQTGQSDRYFVSAGKSSVSTYPANHAGDFIVVFLFVKRHDTGVIHMTNIVNTKNHLTPVDKQATHKEQHPIGDTLL